VLTSDRIKIMEAAARFGMVDGELAELLGVNVATIQSVGNQIRIKRARVEAGVRVAQMIYTAALAGNVTAAIFWMKARHQWREADAETVAASSVAARPPRVLVIE